MLALQHADENKASSLEWEHRELLDGIMEHLRESDGPSAAALMLLRHLASRTRPAASVAHA
jgi:hypothetical protein